MARKNGRPRGNKHRHIANKRLTEWTPCYVCEMLHGEGMAKGATETHEIYYGSAYMRNTSMDYGAQIPICMEHHQQVHANNHGLGKRLKQRFQQQIMNDKDMSMDEWIKIFGKNWI